MRIFSNAFLDVGPAEESVDNGSRFTPHGTFCVSRVEWTVNNIQLLFAFQSNETLTILTNTAIIGINQDPNGQPGIRLWKRKFPEGGDLQLWRGGLTNR